MERDRFALIFNKVNNHLVLDTVTEIIPTDINGYNLVSFIVKSGKYSGYTDNYFNYIRGDNGFCNFLNKDITFVSTNAENFPSIYIFDNRLVDALQEEKKMTRIEVYYYFTKFVYSLDFTSINNDASFTIYDVSKSKKGKCPYTKKIIEKLLSENVYDFDCERYLKELTTEENTLPALSLPHFLMKTSARYREEELDELLEDDFDIKKIIDSVSKKFIAQEEAVKTLVSNIYYNKVLIESMEKNHTFDAAELDSRKVTILLDGTTGTGKTAIVKDVSSKLDLPVVIANANSFSETGYVGPTITDLLKELLRKTDGDKNRAEKGIIVLDEIDKIAVQEERNHSMKQGVQEELLSFIGGGKYNISSSSLGKVEFDTSKITFILMGAFTDIKDKKIKENESKQIGFDTNNSVKSKQYEVTPQDYIDYGLMREFFGRIKVIAATKTYSKEDLKKILLDSTISPLKNFDKTVKLFGHDGITYNDEFIDKIVEEAYKMNTGARGLQTVMFSIQNLLLLDLETGLNSLNKVIELNTNMIEKAKEKNIRQY